MQGKRKPWAQLAGRGIISALSLSLSRPPPSPNSSLAVPPLGLLVSNPFILSLRFQGCRDVLDWSNWKVPQWAAAGWYEQPQATWSVKTVATLITFSIEDSNNRGWWLFCCCPTFSVHYTRFLSVFCRSVRGAVRRHFQGSFKCG